MNLKRLTALLLLIIISSLIMSCNQVPENTEGNKIGDICYTYTLDKISGGTDNITNYKGRHVIIHFFGLWAGDVSEIDKVATDYANDVTVLAIHSTHESTKAPEYISKNYPNSKIIFLYDKRNGNAEDKYYTLLGGTDTYPRTLVLDKNGVITYIKDGAVSYDELVEAIKESK